MEKNIIARVKTADTFWKRFVGYMFLKAPKGPEVLIIKPCNQIHTFNMRFVLNVLFLNDDYKVMAVYRNVAKCRVLPVVKSATIVAETASDVFDGVEVGDCITFTSVISSEKFN